MFGVLFADKKERAFAGLKLLQSLGVTILFAVSEYMCTYMKIYVLLALLLLAATGYVFMELRLRRIDGRPRRMKYDPTSV